MITDTFLNNVARALTNQTYIIPAYLGIGTTIVSAVGATDTSLSGEIGSRVSVTGDLVSNVVTYNSLRTTANVISTATGDVIASCGLFNLSTGGYLLDGFAINGVTQTTNFDLDFTVTLTVSRV